MRRVRRILSATKFRPTRRRTFCAASRRDTRNAPAWILRRCGVSPNLWERSRRTKRALHRETSNPGEIDSDPRREFIMRHNLDMIRHAEAQWNGSLKEGNGHVSTETKALDSAYSFRSRFEGGGETNPEELIGAAHAACFS